MQSHESATPLTIPQRLYDLDLYNAHFSNISYRAFHNALVESSRYRQLSTTRNDEQFIDVTMNLLIDASFERSGAEYYNGSEVQLMAQIVHLDSRLTTLARVHLMNFGGSPLEGAEQALIDARLLAETAAQKAGDIRSWRGRVAYAWVNAAMFLLHAAFAILDENHVASYPLKKTGSRLGPSPKRCS